MPGEIETVNIEFRAEFISKRNQLIRARIAEYKAKTTVVANYYSTFDKVVHIKGEGSVDEIFESLRSEIDKRMS
jgi:adenylate kinase family enzyme